jgi:hypothetical protein
MLFLLAAPVSAAFAEGRLALLIGNQGYSDKIGRLKNPHNDIALVGAALENLGFTVSLVKDAGYKRMDIALRTYIDRVRRAGEGAISFVYYSGHGAADPDTQINYLIPVDVDSAEDASLWTNSLDLKGIVEKLRDQNRNATHYVVFDACRDELRLTRKDKKALGSDKGFVPVGNVAGVLIAYATAPGRAASDVGQGAGPYAKALVQEIVKPGVESVTMFRNVQLKVKQAIGQDPWLSFPTLPAVYFSGKIADPAGVPERQVEKAFWDSVKETGSPTMIRTYLERYPRGEFASLARSLIEQHDHRLEEEQAAREKERKLLEAEKERRAREAAFAEERKRAEEAKNAEQTRLLEEKQRSERLARIKVLQQAREEARRARAAAKAAEEQQQAALKAAKEATERAKVASLPSLPAGVAKLLEQVADNPSALTRALQTELKRVGCEPGSVDGTWGVKDRSALQEFVRWSKIEVPGQEPSEAALRAVASQQRRVCAPSCPWGYIEVGGKCRRQ